jgi:hypothetical protein
MARNEIKNWATQFARDLGEGNTRILFERAVARHVPTIAALRATGLTWPSIASILTQEGVRRADGRHISSDHLRAAYSRVHAREQRKLRAVPGAKSDLPASHRDDERPTHKNTRRPQPSSTEMHLQLKHHPKRDDTSSSPDRLRGDRLRSTMQRARTLRSESTDK